MDAVREATAAARARRLLWQRDLPNEWLFGEEGWTLSTHKIAGQNWSCVDTLKSF